MRYIYCIWCAVALTSCSLECYRILQNASYRPQRGYFKVYRSWHFFFLLLGQACAWVLHLFVPAEVFIGALYTAMSVPLVFARRKSPLKITHRILRMLAVNFLLLLVSCYFALHWWLIFLPLFVLLSWAICLPVDAVIARRYLRQAQRKLSESGIPVIAITGSYGKTSTKDMLSALLGDSIAPKGSCNTPLGIAAYINSADLSVAKYLILEFGARKCGDIAKLCRLYKPRYGIVTGVCPQHLSTFKTLENILATKGELVANLPENGVCVLGDSSVVELQCVGGCKKIFPKVKISDLTVSAQGLHFTAASGKKRCCVALPQITQYSANTFAVCATLCMSLGQNLSTTAENCKRVVQTKHRMEISHNGSFYIIDDSYNGNVKGVEGCVAVLGCLAGCKVAISQGIVEGGKGTRQLNVRCGELLGSVCDVVITLGKNSKYLRLGVEKSQCATLLTAKNLKQAVKIAQPYLQKDSFLLFQNDLPDVVNI